MLIDYEGSWALIYTELSFHAMKRYSATSINLNNTYTISKGQNRYYQVYIDYC